MRALWVVALLAVLVVPPAGASGPSARGAFWRSLLVPGWGQRYLGKPVSAGRFLAAELVLWGGYLGCRRLAEVREDSYQSYAAEHAGARPEGKGSRFLDDLGFYDSTVEHNLYARLSEGPTPALYPDDPEFFWEWETQAARLRYRDLRASGESARRGVLYAGGLVAVNHLVAAVHAARGAADAGAARDASLELESTCDPGDGRLSLALVRRF
jgi:hypothetical protein